MTTRGAKEEEMRHIGSLLGPVLKRKDDAEFLEQVKAEVKQIATSHPMFSSEWVSPSIRDDFDAMYCHLTY